MKVTNNIMDSLQYIEIHLKEQLDLQEISTAAGYSEYHFARMFKEQMGTSVMEYVKKRKLYKASEALFQGQKVLNVALEYGYQSHSGFTKAFKQEYGFSPSLLRAMRLQMDCLEGDSIMGNTFLRSVEECKPKEELFELLKQELENNQIHYNETELEVAYEFSCNLYHGLTRYSGEEYVTHPLNVVILLAQLEMEGTVIIAGLFCDCLKKTSIAVAEMRQKLSCEVVDLVMEVNAFEVNEDNVVPNEKCLMIKLAERLHNMRTVSYLKQESRTMRARETLEIFLPIANKMGNEKMGMELNDLAMQWMK